MLMPQLPDYDPAEYDKKIADLRQAIDDHLNHMMQQIEIRDKEISELKELSPMMEFLATTLEFHAVAEKEGLTVADWIKRTLQEGAREKCVLEVRPEVYAMFKDMADMRGVTVENLCRSTKSTDAFKSLIKNYRL